MSLACGTKTLEISENSQSLSKSSSASDYKERYRLQYHFSPEKNWMNDPNGMVYYDDEYHLFYQYNPYGDKWGHMSWGHAVSPDMLHWEHLPLALAEEDNVMIFSGSAVVDWKNTSGFGKNGEPPMVAIYTGHRTDRNHQSQYIAYSNDKGRSWTKFRGNPVLDIDKEEFRDPKVMWHEESEKWIMVVALPKEFKVQFYGSEDLKTWNFLSDFGPAGAVSGIWECPDFFELEVEGTDEKEWMLYVSLNPGHPAGGSGGQYFVGDFDGKNFTLDKRQVASEKLWVDHGSDFYAAVSFSNMPDDRRVLIGWLSNWLYGQDLPTSPWRSSQSLPRSFSLVDSPDGYRLRQTPVREAEALRGKETAIGNRYIERGEFDLAEKGISGSSFEMSFTLQRPETGRVGVRLFKSGNKYVEVGFDGDSDIYYIDRTASGKTDFHDKFAAIHKTDSESVPIFKSEDIAFRLFVDHSSVEAFFQDGRVAITDRVFPQEGAEGVSLFTTDQEIEVSDITFWPMNGVWASRRIRSE